jgi:hypothetical protein
MGAIVIRTRYDEDTESAEVATSEDEDSNNNKHNTENKKEKQYRPHQKTGGLTQMLAKGKQYLLLIGHPPCQVLLSVIEDRKKHVKRKRSIVI